MKKYILLLLFPVVVNAQYFKLRSDGSLIPIYPDVQSFGENTNRFNELFTKRGYFKYSDHAVVIDNEVDGQQAGLKFQNVGTNMWAIFNRSGDTNAFYIAGKGGNADSNVWVRIDQTGNVKLRGDMPYLTLSNSRDYTDTNAFGIVFEQRSGSGTGTTPLGGILLSRKNATNNDRRAFLEFTVNAENPTNTPTLTLDSDGLAKVRQGVTFGDNTTQLTAFDGRIKVTTNDTTYGYLNEKIQGAGEAVIGILNAGGNEKLVVTFTSTNLTASTNYAWIFPLVQSGTNVYIGTNGISYNLLAQATGNTLLGRSVSSVGNVGEIQATADNQFMFRSSGQLQFLPIPVGITTQKVSVASNYVTMGASSTLNLIPGSNVSLGVTDTGTNVSVTINSAGGGSASLNTTDNVVPVKRNTNFVDSPIWVQTNNNTFITNVPKFTITGTNSTTQMEIDVANRTVKFPNAIGNTGATNEFLSADGKYRVPAGGSTGTNGGTALPVFYFTNFTTAVGDFVLPADYTDVEFDGALVQTDVLLPGTYTVTFTSQFVQYRQAGQIAYLALRNTETDSDLAEVWAGPQVASSFYGEWPMEVKARVTIATAGRVKVRAKGSPADGIGMLRRVQSTLEWKRDTTVIDTLTATNIIGGTFTVTNLTVVSSLTLGGVARTTWPSGGSGSGSLKRTIPCYVPDGIDGTGCTRWNAVNSEVNNRPRFSGTAAASGNYAYYGIIIPDDFDATQDIVLSRFRVMLDNTDTGAQTFFIAKYAGGDGESEFPGSVSDQITVPIASGAPGNQYYQKSATNITLTNWRSNISPGDTVIIKVSRDGNNDASTVSSTVVGFVLTYTSTGL